MFKLLFPLLFAAIFLNFTGCDNSSEKNSVKKIDTNINDHDIPDGTALDTGGGKNPIRDSAVDNEFSHDNSTDYDSGIKDEIFEETLPDNMELDEDSDTPKTVTVKFLEPKDKSEVHNPVLFKIEAQNIAFVEIEVDGWELPHPEFDKWIPEEHNSLEYTFDGTGFEREIALVGYDAEENEIARDIIHITVIDSQSEERGTPLGLMWNTYYYLSSEADYTGDSDTTLYDSACNPIAEVPAAYSDSVCIEGSGKLKDGTVINYASTCSCGRSCPTGGTICYSKLDADKYPWGMGSKNNALEPFISLAVDSNIISFGTVIYLEEWDGVYIPSEEGIGGFVHDGCFRADDIGGWIKDDHFDFFSGTKGMYKILNSIFPTKSKFNTFENGEKCSYLKM